MLRKSIRTRKNRKNLLVFGVITVFLIFGLLGGANLLAMTRVGDAFKTWIGVEIEGKFYLPNAGDGPSWAFWVDPDVGKPGKKAGSPAYPHKGEPGCGGVADLVLRGVDGGGLYVTDSGYLVQVIGVTGHWTDTSYNVKCGSNWCSRPCGERIGDAWIFVQLDKDKLKGGNVVYVEVSDKSVEEWMKYVESETAVISKLKREAQAGDENSQQIMYLGHIEGAELQSQVPFAWFPENSTLKFKITGLPKCMIDYGYCGKGIHYYVYIAPPEGQMFKAVTKITKKVLTTRKTYHRGYCDELLGWKFYDKVILKREGPTPVKVKCIYTKRTTYTNYYYKLIEAETTPQLVTTTMSQITMTEDTLTTVVYTTTMTVNKLIEKNVTLEKTVTTTITEGPSTVTTTTTLPGGTVTVTAPSATYTISNTAQANEVADDYKPPRPLTEIIYEKLIEFYNWLLNVLGLGR